MRIVVIVMDGIFDSALTAVTDVVRVAEALRPRAAPTIRPLELVLAGFAPTVRTFGGLTVPIAERLDVEIAPKADVIVVPGVNALDGPAMETVLLQPDTRVLRAALRNYVLVEGLEVASACTGAFLLAEAGLLDGRAATTSWWLTGLFASRYPQVRLDMTRMVVRDGPFMTAGAAFAHVDLMLALVSRESPTLADAAARHLLVDERPARSIEAALGHLASTDELVTAFEGWVREHIDEPLDVGRAAAALHVGRRTLERHVRTRSGVSPSAVIRRVRLERARHLHRTTELSSDAIATAVGYGSGAALRRALNREI